MHYSYHSCEGHGRYCQECNRKIFKGGDVARKSILTEAIKKEEQL
jgi:hypothetical protein